MDISLNELLTVKGGVDDSIGQLEAILKRNGMELSLLDKIREKRNQDELIVAVIGEVNSGKSTLINSLLRSNLMETSVQIGFTNFNTLIEYGDEYDVQIVFKNNERTANLLAPEDRTDTQRLLWRYVKHPQAEHVYKALSKIRRKEEMARSIDHVILRVPSDFLKLGISLIDTPGYNGGEHWHHDAAAHSVNELADMALILTPCHQALGQEFLQTLKKTFQHGLDESLFVLTKADTIEFNEIDMVMQYVQSTLKNELSLNEPMICPYSSWAVMHDCGMLTNGQYDPVLVAQSHTMEKNMLQMLIERRTRCLLRILSDRIGDVKGQLTSHFDDMQKQLKATQERLVANRKDKLETFAAEQLKTLMDKYT